MMEVESRELWRSWASIPGWAVSISLRFSCGKYWTALKKAEVHRWCLCWHLWAVGQVDGLCDCLSSSCSISISHKCTYTHLLCAWTVSCSARCQWWVNQMSHVWTTTQIPSMYKDHSSIYGIPLGTTGLHFSFWLCFWTKCLPDPFSLSPCLFWSISPLHCKRAASKSHAKVISCYVA